MKQYEFFQPRTSEEVCLSLEKYKGQAVLHAGGTDLLVRLRAGLIDPDCIIDLSRLLSLNSVKTSSQDDLVIGSLRTLTNVQKIQNFKSDYQALYEAIQSIGSLQIRNRGTLVGNICNASPAADSIPPILLYNGTVRICRTKGYRTQAVEDFLTGPGQTTLKTNEFVESIILPKPKPVHSSAYLRIGRRKAVDCSIVGVAVRLDDNGDVRVAFGAVAATSIRAVKTEEYLSGKKWNSTTIDKAAGIVKAEISPIDDIRASKEYRESISQVLFKRTFTLAYDRLIQKQKSQEVNSD